MFRGEPIANSSPADRKPNPKDRFKKVIALFTLRTKTRSAYRLSSVPSLSISTTSPSPHPCESIRRLSFYGDVSDVYETYLDGSTEPSLISIVPIRNGDTFGMAAEVRMKNNSMTTGSAGGEYRVHVMTKAIEVTDTNVTSHGETPKAVLVEAETKDAVMTDVKAADRISRVAQIGGTKEVETVLAKKIQEQNIATIGPLDNTGADGIGSMPPNDECILSRVDATYDDRFIDTKSLGDFCVGQVQRCIDVKTPVTNISEPQESAFPSTLGATIADKDGNLVFVAELFEELQSFAELQQSAGDVLESAQTLLKAFLAENKSKSFLRLSEGLGGYSVHWPRFAELVRQGTGMAIANRDFAHALCDFFNSLPPELFPTDPYIVESTVLSASPFLSRMADAEILSDTFGTPESTSVSTIALARQAAVQSQARQAQRESMMMEGNEGECEEMNSDGSLDGRHVAHGDNGAAGPAPPIFTVVLDHNASESPLSASETSKTASKTLDHERGRLAITPIGKRPPRYISRRELASKRPTSGGLQPITPIGQRRMNYALKSPAPVARRFAMRSSSNTSTMSPGQSATRSSRKANVTSLRLSTVSSSSKTNAASQPSTTAVLSVKIANTRDRTSENPNATRSSVDNTCPVALLRGDTNNASDESPWSRSALPMSHPGGDPLRMPAFRAQVGPKKVESSACDEDMVRMLAMPISPEERRLAQRHQKQQDDTSTSNPAPVSAIKTKSAMLSRVSSMITQTRRAFQVSAPSKEPSRATRLLRDAPASRVHNTPVSAPGKDKVSANKERLQREGRIAIVSSTRTVLPRAEKPSTPCERNARNVARRDAVSVESVESAKVGKENSITQEDKPGIASKEDNVQKPEIEKSQHRRKPLAPRPDLAHYGEVASFGQVGEWIMHADGGVYDDE